MKKISITILVLGMSVSAFSQKWGTTIPEVYGGFDVQYIPELNTTYASGEGTVMTISHDTITSVVEGLTVNKFAFISKALYAATNETSSFRYLDDTWKTVPNVTLDARSFYLDTLGTDILILGESSVPAPGHVVSYDGSKAGIIPGCEVAWPCDHSVTYKGKKYFSYTAPTHDSHLLSWDGNVLSAAAVPDNYGISNLFVSNSNLYATFILLGYYQLWRYDGIEWSYVLQFPQGFSCRGAFNDDNKAIYFFGGALYKYGFADTNLVQIENPISNTIYAMTKDKKTGMYYLSSNFIYWWDQDTSEATGIDHILNSTPYYNFDFTTSTIHIFYNGRWQICNDLGVAVLQGNGFETRNLSDLPSGMYFISPVDSRWRENKFVIAH